MNADELMRDRPLRHFTGYETLGVLGIGGMGVVYKARQTALNRLVAIKTLRNHQDAAPRDLERFQFEAEIVAQFQHPNIVQLYHIGEEEGQPFLAFEFVEGGSLAKQIAGSPQPARDAAALVETLARAVHAAHLRGVVHRDLTPNNILLASDGTPRIADFGLARMQERSGLTAESIAGTASYMAPEQAWGDVQGKSVGPLTDVYGLGAILYELLCGRPPFKSTTSQKTLQMVYQDPPVQPRSIVPTIPRDLEAICLRCLEKEPNRRFASADELAKDLQRFLNGEPIASRSVCRYERLWLWSRRNPVVAWLTLLLVCVGIGSFAAVTERMFAARRAEQAERQRADELDAALYRNQFLVARYAWESSDIERADSILESCNPLRRSLEWHVLSERCRGHRRSLSWQGKSIDHIGFCPTRNLLAVGELSGIVRLIDTSSGKVLHELTGHDNRIAPVAFSPDGLHVASVGSTGHQSWIRIWETDSGKEVKKIGPLQGSGEAIRFLPAADEIGSLAVDSSPFTGGIGFPLVVEVWSLQSGKRIRQVKGPDTDQMRGSLVNAAISPDGRFFAWTPGGILPPGTKHRQEIQICETESGRILSTLVQPTHLFAVKFSFSPDAQNLVSFGDEGGATVWNVLSGKPTLALKQESESIQAAEFSHDGKIVATGGTDFAVSLHAVETGEERKRLRGQPGIVNAIAFSPDGATLATTGRDNSLSTWDLNQSYVSKRVVDAAITDLAFVTRQSELAFTTLDGNLRSGIPDVSRASASEIISPDSLGLAVSADQTQVALISPTGRLRIGIAETTAALEEVLELPAVMQNGGTTVAFRPDNTQLACVSKEGSEVFLIDVATKRLRTKLASPAGIFTCMAYQSNGKLLAAGTDANSICLWESSSGKSLGLIEAGYAIRNFVFRPSSHDLAVIGMQGKFVQIWNVQTREPRIRFENHKFQVNCLLFTPDGRRLITGSADRSVKITDADSGQELLNLADASHEIRQIAISSDGRRLAAAAGTALNSWQLLFWNTSAKSEKSLGKP